MIIAKLALARGRVAFYDKYSNLHFTLADPIKFATDDMNVIGLKKAIKNRVIELRDGSLNIEEARNGFIPESALGTKKEEVVRPIDYKQVENVVVEEIVEETINEEENTTEEAVKPKAKKKSKKKDEEKAE